MQQQLLPSARIVYDNFGDHSDERPELFNVQAQDCLQIATTFSWPLIIAIEERPMLHSPDSDTYLMLHILPQVFLL